MSLSESHNTLHSSIVISDGEIPVRTVANASQAASMTTSSTSSLSSSSSSTKTNTSTFVALGVSPNTVISPLILPLERKHNFVFATPGYSSSSIPAWAIRKPHDSSNNTPPLSFATSATVAAAITSTSTSTSSTPLLSLSYSSSSSSNECSSNERVVITEGKQVEPQGRSRRPRSDSVGLDALADAVLQTSLLTSSSCSSSSISSSSSSFQPRRPGQQQQQQPLNHSQSSNTTASSSSSRSASSLNTPPSSSSSASSSSDEEDSEAMPPPAPLSSSSLSSSKSSLSLVLPSLHTTFSTTTAYGSRARRALLHPEKLEPEQNHQSHHHQPQHRQQQNPNHWVLPNSILEEELAQVNATVMGMLDPHNNNCNNAEEGKEDGLNIHHHHYNKTNISADDVLWRARARLMEDSLEGKMHYHSKSTSHNRIGSASSHHYNYDHHGNDGSISGGGGGGRITGTDDQVKNYSEISGGGGGGGDKITISTATALPHSLLKYKEIYNQNGRIGIYTPVERAAILARFHQKRSRRVWNKKIRYNCRKNLADRRLRVKGRFIKRAEQDNILVMLKEEEEEEIENENEQETANDMPDVTDPEAGFAPTIDQPYRRLRRHTVT